MYELICENRLISEDTTSVEEILEFYKEQYDRFQSMEDDGLIIQSIDEDKIVMVTDNAEIAEKWYMTISNEDYIEDKVLEGYLR